MEPLKRISPGEAENYIELGIYDSKVCTQAIAYTLTDIKEGIYPASSYGTAWQQVTYYGDESSISTANNAAPLSPLEFMYKEWDMNKDTVCERD
jgi:hypothetical protein